MKDYKVVVIIGAPRSGTNMLRDILCTLDGVGTWPCDEINYIWRHGNVRADSDEFTPAMASPNIKKYIRGQFKKLAANQDLDFLVEKTCANSLRVGFVDEILPDAHYIFITRDCKDVVASANLRWTAKLDIPYLIKKVKYVPLIDLPYYGVRYLWSHVYRLFSGEKRLAFWGPQLKGMTELLDKYSLNEICAIQWRRCVDNSKRDLNNISPSRVTNVTYENFVNDSEAELQRILSDLGVSILPEQLKESVQRVSNKSVGKWKGQLSSSDIELIAPHINC